MACIAFGSFISECQLGLVAMLDTAGRVTKNQPRPIFGEVINEDEVIIRTNSESRYFTIISCW